MLIFWRIEYFDRTDKQFKDRDLFLDSAELPSAVGAAIELVTESNRSGNERGILRYRSLFKEVSRSDWEENQTTPITKFSMITIHDYFEDENGDAITMAEIGPILTGDPNCVLVPFGTQQYHIDYMFAEKFPVPIAEVTLTMDEMRIMGYFVRDFEELRDSALMKEGAGTVSMGGTLAGLPNGDYHHQTAVTDDEIRSFMTIFRRLYMDKEPANFVKAATLFEESLDSHPLGKWVKGVADEYNAQLQGLPECFPFLQGAPITFNTKRLIDVFLYTQYAHQPEEKRQRQFTECLDQVGGKLNFLTWLLLREVWKCSLKIANAGPVIANWFNRYCDHHGVTPDILQSLKAQHTGLGTSEKKEVREARLFREKVEELEWELWKNAGKPEGGPVQFRHMAQQQLTQALNVEEGD